MQTTPIDRLAKTRNPPEGSAVLSAAELQDLLSISPIDVRLLLENCIGKPLFAVALLEEFARTATTRLNEFDVQSRQGNLNEVADLAHALKGVAAVLAASTLHEINDDLEASCRNGGGGVDRILRCLHDEVQRIQQEIPCLCANLRRQHCASDFPQVG